MEIIFGLVGIALVLFAVYHIVESNEDKRRFKEKSEARIREIQAERARATAAAYESKRAARSAPITTGVTSGKPAAAPVTTRVAPSVSRRDNSFDFDVDTYTTPTYSSSHSTSSYSSHSCSSSSSSSSSDSSSSSSDSGGGGCD